MKNIILIWTNWQLHSSKQSLKDITYVLEKVDVVRDLGVYVDSFLKFDRHVSFIRPPVYGSKGRTYKMLVMFFFLSFFLFFATHSPSSLDRSP